MVTGKLSALRVKTTKVGKYGDGGGLWLVVRANGSKAWTCRYTYRGQRRELGLGPVGMPIPEKDQTPNRRDPRPDIGLGPGDNITLKEARIMAAKVRELVKRGVDPRVERQILKGKQAGMPTFKEAALAYLELKGPGMSEGYHYQWKTAFETHVYPTIGNLQIDAIDRQAVVDVLKPIWTKIPELAHRIRRWVEQTWSYAAAKNHVSGDNPAAWGVALELLLPNQGVRVVRHHPAIDWRVIGEFMPRLRAAQGTGARALEFVILTATRAAEVRQATWDQIDLEARLWTIPPLAPGSKNKPVSYRIPLSDQSVDLLRNCHWIKGDNHIFAGMKRGHGISDQTMPNVLKRLGVDFTPHGFRSAFKDWASESTTYKDIVSEMALGHAIPSAVEKAYRRGELLDRRQTLMQDWADYIDTISTAQTAEVVGIGAGR